MPPAPAAERAPQPAMPEPSYEPEPRPEPAPPQREPQRRVSPQIEKYRDMLSELSGSSKARILDDRDEIAVEVPVRELVETLKTNTKKVRAIVFDGIITQRILDIAADIGIKAVVGAKMGTVAKQPASVQILTRSDLTG